MSQSYFKQADTAFLENASLNGLPANPAVASD
jgi:hypothetical protein